MVPRTSYAKTGDIHIAYQVVGEGERDIVLVPGFATHVELEWEEPRMARQLERLSSFGRLILFDKRGTGLSDRSVGIPTLEERMDDVRTVMDAAGSERAVLIGISEGAPMCILFAATYPERAVALVLIGGMARSTWAPDYPWAPPAEGLIESAQTMIAPYVFTGEDIEIWVPSLANDEKMKEFIGKYRRSAISPAGLADLFQMFLNIDVRHVLPTLHVPTLVIHRRGDRVVNRRAGKWMADQIPGARYVELPGQDHIPWAGDADGLMDEIEEFVTGARPVAVPDRVLATVMFIDIVDSTKRAAELGDAKWRQTLEDFYSTVRSEIARFRGREVKMTGDGCLATFDGPARAIRCAIAITAAVRSLGLAVRTGLHTGECETMGADVGGIAVHTAARVSEAAAAGEILVSRMVTDLVAGSGLTFTDRGEHDLRGVPGRWNLFAASV